MIEISLTSSGHTVPVVPVPGELDRIRDDLHDSEVLHLEPAQHKRMERVRSVFCSRLPCVYFETLWGPTEHQVYNTH